MLSCSLLLLGDAKRLISKRAVTEDEAVSSGDSQEKFTLPQGVGLASWNSMHDPGHGVSLLEEEMDSSEEIDSLEESQLFKKPKCAPAGVACQKAIGGRKCCWLQQS